MSKRGRKPFNYIGHVFDGVTVIGQIHKESNGEKIQFLTLRCSCGQEFSRNQANYLHRTKNKKCKTCSLVNFVGKKFGELTVIAKSVAKYSGCYSCICSCGNIKDYAISNVIRHTRCCSACTKKNKPYLTRFKDPDARKVLIVKIQKLKRERYIAKWLGKKHFFLKVIKYLGQVTGTREKVKNKHCLFLCKCVCGKKIEVSSYHLPFKKSCGCMNFKQKIQSCAKLTELEVVQIRELFSSGMYTCKDLAKIFNVHLQTVSQVVRRLTYINIP